MILTGLFLFKQLCCKADNQLICTVMAATVIALVFLGKRLFDESNENDPPKWLLAIPVSIWIVCLAVLDWSFLTYTTDIKKRVFYNLDTGLKVWWVRGHVGASFIYSGLLFYWLWKMENNEDNNAGKKED